MIYIDVKRAGFDDVIAAGMVLSGGTSSLPGICELSEMVLRMPVRAGLPRGIHRARVAGEGSERMTERTYMDGLPPIKVVGVGGGGCNAVNRMVQSRIAG